MSKTIEEMLDAGMSIPDIMRKATEIKKKKDVCSHQSNSIWY